MASVLTADQVYNEILAEAKLKNVDPAAAIAVAGTEGGLNPAPGHYDPSASGTPGWSYGPWQLRSPGALPIASSGEYGPGYYFAWNKTGIDYAIDQLAAVSAGQTGNAAITSIVSRFERPADPSAEIAKAEGYYSAAKALTSSGLPTTGGGVSGAVQGVASGVGGAVGGAVGGVTGAVSGVTGAVGSIEDAFKFIFSYRFLEILGGGALVLVGIIALAKDANIAVPAPAPAKKAAGAIA